MAYVKHEPRTLSSVDRAVEKWLSSLSERPSVCVAFSGGVDSSVLLHALEKARSSDFAPVITAIHVHHGLSPNASLWAEHCKLVCTDLDVPLTVMHVSVNTTKTHGVEAAARSARYGALRTHAAATDAIIALAHHARDQAETVLLQLLRGAGPRGLAAMPELRTPFARPLLGVEKAEIDAYVGEHGIRHIVDESNTDSRFARNRLRTTVWPVLTTSFEAAERTLARAAVLQHESDELSRALAEIDLAHCEVDGALLASKWRTLSSARRRNALRLWLERKGILTPSSERLRDWERQLLTESETQNLVLTHSSFDGSIRCYRDRVQFVEPDASNVTSPANEVRWSGESSLSFGAGRVEFLSPIRQIESSQRRNTAFFLRPIENGENWVIRTRREKDKLFLSPKSGGVPAKNLFQQADVPPWLRAKWPIITCNGQVAAIPGVAIDHQFASSDANFGYALSFHFSTQVNEHR